MTLYLAHVVVPLLHAQAGESQRGLPAAPMLLGQVHRELVQHLARVAAQRAEQRAVAIHHYEAVPVSSAQKTSGSAMKPVPSLTTAQAAIIAQSTSRQPIPCLKMQLLIQLSVS